MKKVLPIFFLCAAAGAPRPWAQTLEKEIAVDRDIVPEFREASKLRILPEIALPPIKPQNLTYSLSDIPVKVSYYPTVLGVPSLGAAPADSSRGYVAAGYMPLRTASVSAGYRIIDSRNTTLGTMLDFNNTGYHTTTTPFPLVAEDGRYLIRFSTFNGGIYGRQTTGSTSALDVTALYSYSRYTTGRSFQVKRPYATQGVNRFNVSAGWGSDDAALSYHVGADVGRFAYIYSAITNFYDGFPFPIEDLPGTQSPRETSWCFSADIEKKIDALGSAAMEVDFSHLSTNFGEYYGTKDSWLLSFIPHIDFFTTGSSRLRAGVKVDITHGAGKSLHIAPDVCFTFSPSSSFRLWAKASGGEVQNTLPSLYAASPFLILMPSSFNLDEVDLNSHIPFTIDAGIVAGPYNGFYAELKGGYAKANDWLLPELVTHWGWMAYDVKAFHGGVTLGYLHSAGNSIKATAEFAQSGKDDIKKTYYLWRDRARAVISVEGNLRPLSFIELTGKYQFRSGRKCGEGGLGAVSNIGLGITYNYSPKLAFFLNGDNLLNRKYLMLGAIESNGINGLAGVSYKF